MRIIKYIVYFFILLIPINVYASVSLSCPSSVKSGSSFNCTVFSVTQLSSLDAKLNLPSGFYYTGNDEGDNFISSGTGTNLKFTNNGGTPDTVVAVLHLSAPTVSSDTTSSISLTNISMVYYNTTATVTNADVSVSVKVLANTTTTTTTTSSTFKTFTVTFNNNNGTNETSASSCTTTSSKCSIDLTKITIPTKTGYSFNGWGSSATCTSGNTSVYSASKNTTLYACWNTATTSSTTTTSTTTSASSTILYLKSLEIEDQELEFSKFKFAYSFKVLYDVTSLNITALPVLGTVTVSISDNASNLEVGENVVDIKLTDGTNTTTYSLTVTRLNEGEEITEASSDATLSSINLGDYSVSFSPTVTSYNLTIGYNVKSLNISAITTDENATYEVSGNSDLTTGSIVRVTVTAEDGTTNIYKFNITVQSFIEYYMLYIIIGGVAVLAILVFIIIMNNKKKTSGSSKAKAVKVPKKPKKSNPKDNIEVLN